MRISYIPTFAHFADNYLATYYSSGIKTFKRTAGGPTLLVLGFIISNLFPTSGFANFLGLAIGLYGAYLILTPFLNLLLVWLRKDQVIQNTPITLEFDARKKQILIIEEKGNLTLPLKEINSIQHRSDRSWLLTKSDQLIYIPMDNLITGNHDEFIRAVEKKLDQMEQKY